jgi:hypothetical protein
MILSPYFGLIPLDLYGIYPFSQRDWVEPDLNLITKFAFETINDFISQNKDKIQEILVYNPFTQNKHPKMSPFVIKFLSMIKKEKFIKKWGEIIEISELDYLKNYCSSDSFDSE